VGDIEKLRNHLELEKIILFGGSWGSTLGLAYAETYPKNVSGMVLRGIFTATKEETDHFFSGGVRPFFPETYEKLKKIIGQEPSAPAIYQKVLRMRSNWLLSLFRMKKLNASSIQMNWRI
jgi:proline iminopeptidase